MKIKDLSVEQIKENYPQLPNVIFEWDNYAVKNGVDLGSSVIEEVEITGWTFNKGLKVKPSNFGISIMFIYQDHEYWQHLNKYFGELTKNIYFDVEIIENKEREVK